VVPHRVSPSAQADVHAPLLQTWFDEQAVAQSPQWVASGDKQALLQTTPDTHRQTPP
jgi:hypothetical protein